MASENGKFKVGDRVRRVKNFRRHVPEGYVSTVLDGYEFADKDGDRIYINDSNWELVPAWQPKVGDRVLYKNGAFGDATVTEVIDARTVKVNTHGRYGICTERLTSLLPATPTTLTIEAGRYYKTRDGRKVGPVRTRSDSTHPWLSNFENNTGDPSALIFRADGRNYSRKHLDLVALWEEPAGNDNAAVAKPKFKVGDQVTGYAPAYGNVTGKIIYIDETSIVCPYKVAVDVSGVEVWVTGFGAKLAPTTPAIVALIENGTPHPSTAPKVHTSQEAATTEAERLALEHPGQQFGVFVLADSKIADLVTTQTAVLRAA